jgi:hypothetical protein
MDWKTIAISTVGGLAVLGTGYYAWKNYNTPAPVPVETAPTPQVAGSRKRKHGKGKKTLKRKH